MTKFYVLYKKDDKSLYAYSENLNYVERFLQERNANRFKLKEIKIESEEESRIFRYTNRDYKLNEFPYQNSLKEKDYVCIMATIKEDYIVDCELEHIQEKCNKYLLLLEKVGFKKKYKKSIENFLYIVNNHNEIELDVFSLFVDLFKDTFV